MSIQKIGDLELAQDLRFQEKSWRYQRIGWAVMGLVVLLALAGFLGKGKLSSARAGGAVAGLEVEFERFGRRNSPQTLRFHLASPPDADGKIKVSIDREYLESIQIESMTPEPESVEAGPDRQIFEFKVPGGETIVSFKMKPEAMGAVEGIAGLEGRPSVAFGQFVYP